jgi:hypothetical protein
MNELKVLLKEIFPTDCWVEGNKISQEGKIFSVKKSSQNEMVAGVKIDDCSFKKRIIGKVCEGLFIVRKNNQKALVVLLELKGGHTQHALKQIENTAQYLKGQVCHHKQKIDFSHLLPVLGLIVTEGRFSLNQLERKRLRKNLNLAIEKLKLKEAKGISVSRLYDIWNKKTKGATR